MCWTTKKPIVRRIAEEDVPVFKVCRDLSGQICSFFKFYDYSLNLLYTHREPLRIRAINSIEEGFHSYSSQCTVTTQGSVLHIKFENKEVFSYPCYDWVILVKGIIPKGSEYLINELGECVSNSIYLTKIVKLQYVLDNF